MARIDPESLADEDDDAPDLDLTHTGRDHDGVGALRDTEAEAGDESEIVDDFDLDDREARELGVDLDDRDEAEPGFG